MAEIAGLKLIVPTSVSGTGVSVSASGKVTWSGASATDVNVLGVFSSTYDNYLIVIRFLWGGSGNSGFEPGLNLRFRDSGGVISSGNYTFEQLEANGSTVAGSRVSSTSLARIGGIMSSTLHSGTHVYVYGPNLSQPTAHRNVGVGGSQSAYLRDIAGTFSLSTQMTGFNLFTDGSAAFSGSCVTYGLSQ